VDSDSSEAPPGVEKKALSQVLSGLLRAGVDRVRRSERPPATAVGAAVVEGRRARGAAGNCAQWTSAGIKFAGLVKRPRLFPKAILVDLLESEHRARPDNVHVVKYAHVAHAPPYLADYRFKRRAYAHPLSPLRNAAYADTEAYADVVVAVPAGASAAVATWNDRPRRPPRWLPAVDALTIGGPTLVLCGAVDHVGPLGPGAAALWLGLNWWLH